jgi:hypothetical protein
MPMTSADEQQVDMEEWQWWWELHVAAGPGCEREEMEFVDK